MQKRTPRNHPGISHRTNQLLTNPASDRGFLRWLDQTGGLDAALWFDFRDIRTADFVLDQIGSKFYGDNFRLAPNKLDLLKQACKPTRAVIVWDNFKSTASNQCLPY